MTKLFQHTAAAFAAVLIMTATFAPIMAVPQVQLAGDLPLMIA